VIIAMAIQVIGDNGAPAFSLVGTASIVRFRTVVQNTRETAFVILAVAAGMAIGVGHADMAADGGQAKASDCCTTVASPREAAGASLRV
jgi:hypothetical protein